MAHGGTVRSSDAEFEVDVVARLGEAGAPVAALEPRVAPRVYVRDGFAVTLWTYYETAAAPDLAPAEYARALERLHAGMRRVDVPAPHFTDRVAQAHRLVDDPARTPELAAPERRLLRDTLTGLSRAIVDYGAEEQLLHGEPHPGNLLDTTRGPLFIDLETCCRGPVEFDVAHAPEPVGEHYPAADPVLLRQCRTLTLAIATAWRWDRHDRLPDGRRLGRQWLGEIREQIGRR